MTPSHPLDLLLVIDKLSLAGAQRNLGLLAVELRERGFAVGVLALLESGPLAETLTAKGVQVFVLPSCGRGLLGHAKRLLAMRAVLKKTRPRMVQSYLFLADLYAATLRKLQGFCWICAKRQCGYFREPGQGLLRCWMNRQADQVTANAEEVARFVATTERYPLEKISVLRNGVPLPEAPSYKVGGSAPVRILSVGNLTPVKGHRFLLEILSALGTPPCPLEVTLVGDGSERETLTLMAQKLPSAIKVLLVGKQEATPFFAAADLFILPSQSEGMSNALLEAMSFGLCCLATKTGGTPEILTPGTDGFLIEYGDAKGAATLLLNLLENPEARRRVGEAARKKITDLYSVPRLADGWLKLAETLLPGFTQKRRMGLVLSLFPELYETFLLRDIQALENAGYQFDFFSLKRHREEFPHPEYRRYVTKTHQSPLICGRTLLAFLQQSLRHPIRMMTILLFILYHGAMQPLEGFKTLGTLPLACYFAGILARRGLTHLHAHWHNVPSTVAFFMAQLNNIPWTLTVHGEDIYHGAPFLKGKAKHVGHVSSCAKAIDDCLRRDYLPTQVPSEVLYHGLDLDRFCPGPEPKDDPPLLLAVGRIEESKGYDILARAARQLKDQGLRFNVRVLGKGPLEVRLKALLQELDITDCFHLEGFVPQSGIVAWYRRATAFVLPCIHRYHWGIPNVTLEAMAMRLPVVVSDLPGLLEFCREGENALIVQEKDVTRTAEALRRLLTDPALCERLGQNGRATVERLFDIRKNGAALVQCFDRLLGLPENPPPLKKETL